MKSLKTYLLVLLEICIAAFAQAQTGSVSGKVVDDSSAAFPGVVVELKNTRHKTITNSKGTFKFSKINPGDYTLICTGMCNMSSEHPVTVYPGKDTFLVIKSKHSVLEMGEVVISATRTEKDINEIPVPTKVITSEQIQQSGSLRLNDILQEQTGLTIVNDHGTGLQLQGMSSDYTLILVDGEPLIGRTAGTFDLTRMTLGNIERIEIVKGPSSSLYGSEALAGVVNIITSKPKEGWNASLKTRYGTNNTSDFTADVNLRNKNVGLYLFANRYETTGYDLLPESKEPTVPPFSNYTFQSKLTWNINTKLDLSLSGRYFTEGLKNYFEFTENNQLYQINEKGNQYDWNLNPVLTWWVGDNSKLITRLYGTSYHTSSSMTYLSDGSTYDESFFTQSFRRPEVQFNHFWNKKHQSIAGSGMNFESVHATRYAEKKYFSNFYGFLQHDMTVLKKLNVIAGARMDAHSVYGSRISPKVSAYYKIKDWIGVKASAGSGFKAPDFRQLYLNFTNQVAGYSVFGSEEITYALGQLNQQGLISQVLIDVENFQRLKAESSNSINAGFTLRSKKLVTLNVNFFRNDVKDLIETAPVAIKTNGQSVFTYYNISKVYTQGFETDVTIRLPYNFRFMLGYQFMEAKDKQVIEDIEAGTVYTKDPQTLVTRRLQLDEYGGLFNRSKHMGNARLFYRSPKSGWGATVRCIYRGKYGFGDVNGNLVLDHSSEYVDGYFLWNASVSKDIKKAVTLQAGVDNIFGFTNPQLISSVPGRIVYGSLRFFFNKDSMKFLTKNNSYDDTSADK